MSLPSARHQDYAHKITTKETQNSASPSIVGAQLHTEPNQAQHTKTDVEFYLSG